MYNEFQEVIYVEFGELKLKNIDCVVNYKADKKHWTATDRVNHIIGVKLRGAAFHDFGKYQFTMTENCIYFLNQKNDYAVDMLENGETISVHFTTYEPVDTESFCVKVNSTGEVVSLLEKIRSAGSEHVAMSNFYKLCHLFEEHRKKTYSRGDSRINAAKEYIDNHFAEKSCLEVAADECGISRRHFNGLFKKQFDISPNRYVVLQKINRACRLLHSSDLSAAEIADVCGFGDVYYFGKVFKQETGFTPQSYREGKKN